MIDLLEVVDANNQIIDYAIISLSQYFDISNTRTLFKNITAGEIGFYLYTDFQELRPELVINKTFEYVYSYSQKKRIKLRKLK